MAKEYEAPQVTELGSFRELTQTGNVGNCGDPFTISSADFECATRS